MSWRDRDATVGQLNFAKGLAEQLGIDDQYEWLSRNFTQGEIDKLIKKFKSQLGMANNCAGFNANYQQ